MESVNVDWWFRLLDGPGSVVSGHIFRSGQDREWISTLSFDYYPEKNFVDIMFFLFPTNIY